MDLPDHRGRTANDILSKDSYLESSGYLFRAVSWLDYFRRIDSFPALLYACIEGRFGIEYLLFEELVVATGAKLSRSDYEKCIKEGHKLYKLIDRLSPDHEMLKRFTAVLVSLDARAPKLVFWDTKDLLKQWGILSEYVHWTGSKFETTERKEWRDLAAERIEGVLLPLWKKTTSGQSGLFHPSDMKPPVREIWEDFRAGRADEAGARIRLDILKPILVRNRATLG